MVTTKTSPHAGNEPSDGEHRGLNFDIPDALLAEVDFKWLMAGHGWDIDMARLGDDPAYAAGLLDWAKRSDSSALRECAAKLEAQINNAKASSKT